MIRAWLGTCAILLLIAFGGPAQTYAQDRAPQLRLVRPRCPDLPFDYERLRLLLEVELSLDGVTLTEDEGALLHVQYEAVRCGESSQVEISARHRDRPEPILSLVVDGANARALALFLAEGLRGATDLLGPRPTPPDPTPPDPTTPLPTTPLSSPRAAGDLTNPYTQEASRDMSTLGLLGGDFLVSFLYNPENQSWLLTPHLDLSVRMPFLRNLRVHLDGNLGAGRSDWALMLVGAQLGAWIGVAFGDADLSLELGPRFSLTGATGLLRPHDEIADDSNVMLALSGLVRGALRVVGAASLIVDLEMGGAIDRFAIRFQSQDDFNRFGGGISDFFLTGRFGVRLD